VELVLVRHGHAQRDKYGQYARSPLSPRGREQAAQLAEYLATLRPFDALYASPLPRAVETAQIVAARLGLVPQIRTDLEEWRGFEVPGLFFAELATRLPPLEHYLIARAGKPLHWPLVGRVARVIAEIAQKHPSDRVLVVAHGGVIVAALAWYFPQERRRWWRQYIKNCAVTRLVVESHTARLYEVNDVSFLPREGEGGG
jgi:broad specificity phosphatase PhoE